ncbi:MAG TPA: hypothetical protein VFB74_14675 [Kribbellaceae bacterium]|nr:hypothetical protein [Kribbellaceae bacterium]
MSRTMTHRLRQLFDPDRRDRGEGALQTTVITVALLALAIAVAAAITLAVKGRLPGIF